MLFYDLVQLAFTFFPFYIQIESALPALGKPIMSLNGEEDAIVGALKQSLVNYDLFMSFFWHICHDDISKHAVRND